MSERTRNRAVHKVHILSWVLALDKNGYVPCHFEKCRFMALNVQEMANHFVCCSRRNNELKYTCHMCNQGTDSKEKLIYHKVYSHDYNASEEELRDLETYQNTEVKKEVSPVLRKSWSIFYEKKSYYKCFYRPCLYVTDSLVDMENHFLHCCNKKCWDDLRYQCYMCQGKFITEANCEQHINSAHPTQSDPITINKSTLSTTDVIGNWARAIIKFKQAKCPIPDCKFYSNNVSTLGRHFKFCNGNKNENITCPICDCWIINECKLQEHIKCIHKDSEKKYCKGENLDNTQPNNSLSNDKDEDGGKGLLSGSKEYTDKKISYSRNLFKNSCSSLSAGSLSTKKNNENKSINFVSQSDRSKIQFTEDILNINTLSLEIANVSYNNFHDPIGDKIYVDVNDRTKQDPSTYSVPKKKNQPEKEGSEPKIIPSFLEEAAKEVMMDTKNTLTVPIQITFGDTEGVNITENVMAPMPVKHEFPKTLEDVFKASRRNSFKLLQLIAPKTTIRNDEIRSFDPYKERICPFSVSFKIPEKPATVRESSATMPPAVLTEDVIVVTNDQSFSLDDEVIVESTDNKNNQSINNNTEQIQVSKEDDEGISNSNSDSDGNFKSKHDGVGKTRNAVVNREREYHNKIANSLPTVMTRVTSKSSKKKDCEGFTEEMLSNSEYNSFLNTSTKLGYLDIPMDRLRADDLIEDEHHTETSNEGFNHVEETSYEAIEEDLVGVDRLFIQPNSDNYKDRTINKSSVDSVPMKCLQEAPFLSIKSENTFINSEPSGDTLISGDVNDASLTEHVPKHFSTSTPLLTTNNKSINQKFFLFQKVKRNLDEAENSTTCYSYPHKVRGGETAGEELDAGEEILIIKSESYYSNKEGSDDDAACSSGTEAELTDLLNSRTDRSSIVKDEVHEQVHEEHEFIGIDIDNDFVRGNTEDIGRYNNFTNEAKRSYRADVISEVENEWPTGNPNSENYLAEMPVRESEHTISNQLLSAFQSESSVKVEETSDDMNIIFDNKSDDVSSMIVSSDNNLNARSIEGDLDSSSNNATGSLNYLHGECDLKENFDVEGVENDPLYTVMQFQSSENSSSISKSFDISKRYGKSYGNNKFLALAEKDYNTKDCYTKQFNNLSLSGISKTCTVADEENVSPKDDDSLHIVEDVLYRDDASSDEFDEGRTDAEDSNYLSEPFRLSFTDLTRVNCKFVETPFPHRISRKKKSKLSVHSENNKCFEMNESHCGPNLKSNLFSVSLDRAIIDKTNNQNVDFVSKDEKRECIKHKATIRSRKTVPMVHYKTRDRPPKGYYKKMNNCFSDVSAAVALRLPKSIIGISKSGDKMLLRSHQVKLEEANGVKSSNFPKTKSLKTNISKRRKSREKESSKMDNSLKKLNQTKRRNSHVQKSDVKPIFLAPKSLAKGLLNSSVDSVCSTESRNEVIAGKRKRAISCNSYLEERTVFDGDYYTHDISGSSDELFFSDSECFTEIITKQKENNVTSSVLDQHYITMETETLNNLSIPKNMNNENILVPKKSTKCVSNGCQKKSSYISSVTTTPTDDYDLQEGRHPSRNEKCLNESTPEYNIAKSKKESDDNVKERNNISSRKLLSNVNFSEMQDYTSNNPISSTEEIKNDKHISSENVISSVESNCTFRRLVCSEGNRPNESSDESINNTTKENCNNILQQNQNEPLSGNEFIQEILNRKFEVLTSNNQGRVRPTRKIVKNDKTNIIYENSFSENISIGKLETSSKDQTSAIHEDKYANISFSETEKNCISKQKAKAPEMVLSRTRGKSKKSLSTDTPEKSLDMSKLLPSSCISKDNVSDVSLPRTRGTSKKSLSTDTQDPSLNRNLATDKVQLPFCPVEDKSKDMLLPRTKRKSKKSLSTDTSDLSLDKSLDTSKVRFPSYAVEDKSIEMLLPRTRSQFKKSSSTDARDSLFDKCSEVGKVQEHSCHVEDKASYMLLPRKRGRSKNSSSTDARDSSFHRCSEVSKVEECSCSVEDKALDKLLQRKRGGSKKSLSTDFHNSLFDKNLDGSKVQVSPCSEEEIPSDILYPKTRSKSKKSLSTDKHDSSFDKNSDGDKVQVASGSEKVKSIDILLPRTRSKSKKSLSTDMHSSFDKNSDADKVQVPSCSDEDKSSILLFRTDGKSEKSLTSIMHDSSFDSSKVQVPSGTEEDKAPDMLLPRKRSRSQKSTDTGDLPDKSSGTCKMPFLSCSEENKGTDKLIKKKRGRPKKKSLTTSTLDSTFEGSFNSSVVSPNCHEVKDQVSPTELSAIESNSCVTLLPKKRGRSPNKKFNLDAEPFRQGVKRKQSKLDNKRDINMEEVPLEDSLGFSSDDSNGTPRFRACRKKTKNSTMAEGDFYESEEEEKLKQKGKKRLVTGRVDATTKVSDPDRQVTCAVCNESMTLKIYQQHHLVKHNFLAWLEGEVPLPLDDTRLMITILNRGKNSVHKKFSFTCEECGMAKRSAVGFLSHRQFCGKTDQERDNMMVACEICGRKFMPCSLAVHHYQAHQNNGSLEVPPVEEELTVRKAAAKCLNRLADFSDEEVTRDKDEEFDELKYNEYSNKIIRTNRVMYVPVRQRCTKFTKALWKEAEEKGETICCSTSPCDFKTDKYDDMVAHFKVCRAGHLGFSCKKCNLVSKIEEDIREHVKECNLLNAISQSESSDDDDRLLYFIPEDSRRQRRRGFIQIEPSIMWMKGVYERCYSKDSLYMDYDLSVKMNWNPLIGNDALNYFSEQPKSLKVKFEGSERKEINSYEADVYDGKSCLGFTGGTIWAMAWCPGKGEQFIATAPQSSMKCKFQMGSTYKGASVVQLWTIGDVNNSMNSTLEHMKFSYALCHDERGCWDIAWCPGGGRTDNRIGLLALATMSGSIPVYSLPHPKLLPTDKTKHFKFDPVVRLELCDTEKWQCRAVSWSKLKPHRIVAAGFSNGLVALWDLTVRSTLLRQKKDILYPFRTFQAHNAYISGICLSPESEDFLATTSFDNTIKFWNLKNTCSPVSDIQRGSVTGIDWLRYWMMLATSYDNAYTLSQTTLCFTSLRGSHPPIQAITTTDSTSWSVSTNDWMNCVAVSYDNGQVAMVFTSDYISRTHRDKKKSLKVVAQSSLEELPKDDDGSSLATEINESCTSYSNAKNKYGINIQLDMTMDGKELKENTQDSPMDVYPLNSVNKVVWNPNEQSFTYLAMGYHSGLLLVSKLAVNSANQAIIEEISRKKP